MVAGKIGAIGDILWTVTECFSGNDEGGPGKTDILTIFALSESTGSSQLSVAITFAGLKQ